MKFFRSFVTSFFGMNTTDVRDIDWDQRIFWTSALPITFGVITLAFVYGYKWDSIVESLSRRVPSQRSRSPRHILEDDLIPLAEDKKTEPRKQANEPMEEEVNTTGSRRVIDRLRRRNKKPGAIPRRETGEFFLR